MECKCCKNDKEIEEDKCVCDECILTEDGKIIAIKEYLKEYPNATSIQVCKFLGISVDQISKLVEKGVLEFKERNYVDQYMKIKQYLSLMPNSSVIQISVSTGIPTSDIRKLIDLDYFTETPRGVQPTRIRKNNKQNEEDRRKVFVSGLATRTSRISNYQKSKLVEDLEKLKNNRDLSR